jgi:hypothetical protein
MSKQLLEDFMKAIETTGKKKETVKQAITSKQDIEALYKKPVNPKGLDVPHIQVFAEGEICQMDLIFLPPDHGKKYLLVVVDDHTRKVDAEPLMDKTSAGVARALAKIFNRNVIKLPKVMECDPGSEFKGDCRRYLNDNNCRIRYGLTNRHDSQALVERKNQLLGTLLYRGMTEEELRTNKESRRWLQYLPTALEVINKNLPKPLTEEIYPNVVATKQTQEIYPEGTMVRLKLDYPIGVVEIEHTAKSKNKKNATANHEKLSGTFRDSDIRWTREAYPITHILLKPGFPPMYLVGDDNENARIKQDLMPIDPLDDIKVEKKEKKLKLQKQTVQLQDGTEAEHFIPTNLI